MVRNERTDAERRNAGCPSMATMHWVLHMDCLPSGLSTVLSSVGPAKAESPVKVEGPAKEGLAEEGRQVRSRQDEEGCAVLRPPQFLLSAFCFPNFGFTEPFIRAILNYFELFRVNLSSSMSWPKSAGRAHRLRPNRLGVARRRRLIHCVGGPK